MAACAGMAARAGALTRAGHVQVGEAASQTEAGGRLAAWEAALSPQLAAARSHLVGHAA
jgi:hypothetical protein